MERARASRTLVRVQMADLDSVFKGHVSKPVGEFCLVFLNPKHISNPNPSDIVRVRVNFKLRVKNI